MAADSVIRLHGRSVDIVRRSRGALSDVLQSKFGCVAVIEGVDAQHDNSVALQGKPAADDQPRFSVTLRAGVRVSVWKGDLTVFKADAVVNAANTDLYHCGGLALALSNAGGPEVQRESRDHIRIHGPLKTGDAVVTGPGMLPCKHIIHAVGPYLNSNPWKSQVSQAEPLLKKAIRSILDRVKQHSLQSVAIPAISSGLFHYPLKQCADTIVSTVKEYFNTYNPRTFHPKEIFLVSIEEPTVREMTRACQQILGPHSTVTYSQATASKSRGDTKTSAHSLQIGSVHLKLKKGRIEEQKTDVIVNTTSKDRDLKMGCISRSLLEKAGDEMQQDMLSASPTGNVIITSGCKLYCKKVFHTCCTEKKSFAEQFVFAQKTLSDSVSECLWLAVTGEHKSIAFPAIGTGRLGFSGQEVASIMFNAVADFAQKSRKALEVHFVIYPQDSHTFQAFEEQMKCLEERVSGPGFELAFSSTDDSRPSEASCPQIILSGRSEEVTREAERWLQSLLFNPSDTFIICNNFILHFGKQEYQQLSLLTQRAVLIQEFLDKGRAGIKVKGELDEEVAVCALQVEAMLCKIQEQFVREEEQEIHRLLMNSVPFGRKIPASPQEAKDRLLLFGNNRMRMIQVEKVENQALKELFDLKNRQLKCSAPRSMFQCIPAQFIEMVCHIGFHAEFAPPQDPAFGEGIYFAGTVERAVDVWDRHREKVVYFVEAEVLTGNSTAGEPGLFLPPADRADPQTRYHSVSGGPDISVIFSGYQALPRYIVTCELC